MADNEDFPVEDNSTNKTGRQAASTEGLVVAYTILFLMAIVPILIGAIRSVTYHRSLKVVKKENIYCLVLSTAYVFSRYLEKGRESKRQDTNARRRHVSYLR